MCVGLFFLIALTTTTTIIASANAQDHAAVVMNRAIQLIQVGKYAEAENLVLSNRNMALGLAEVYVSMKRADTAINLLQKEMTMAHAQQQPLIPAYLGQTMLEAARNEEMLKDACRCLQVAVRINNNSNNNNNRANALGQLALCYLKRGEREKTRATYIGAIKAYEKKTAKELSLLRLFIADACSSKDPNLAMYFYRTAVQLDPNLFSAYQNAGSTMLLAHNHTECFKWYRQALALNQASGTSTAGLFACANRKGWGRQDDAIYSQLYAALPPRKLCGGCCHLPSLSLASAEFPYPGILAYHSEHGQDLWLHRNVFPQLCGRDAVFVDIGAGDGAVFSNTLFFEKEMGWTGLCIEADPYNYELLKYSGRKCRSVFAAVSNRDHDEHHLNRFEHSNEDNGCSRWSSLDRIPTNVQQQYQDYCGDVRKSTTVPVISLCDVFALSANKHGHQQIQLLSVDVNGAQDMVLMHHQCSQYLQQHVNTILISTFANQQTDQLSNYLSQLGYQMKEMIYHHQFWIKMK